jgi:glycosyltransferase involved in cell wall biosynthesis
VYRFPFFARNRLLIEHTNIPYSKMILYFTTGFFLTIYAVFKNRCNVIHAHWAIPTGLIGVWVRILLKKRLIVTIHGSDLRMALEGNKLIRKIFVYVCKMAAQVSCVSEVQRREMEQLGIMREKISTVPMGVDEGFLEAGRNRKIEVKKGPFVVLSNRNLLPIYNVSLLIRAIPTVLREEPDTKFFIAGDGPERGQLEKEAKRLNVSSSIEFFGGVPHEQMADLLGNADIYVSTSLHDGASVSLLEAMASGTFPVVTDIMSNREWISDGGNGFLVPTEGEKVLAKRIVEVIRNQRLMVEACKKNQRIVEERANWRKAVEHISRIYEKSML